MISHEHKCILIHIPKTAGTSIEQCLVSDNPIRLPKQDHRSIINLENSLLPNRINDVFGLSVPRYLYQRYAANAANLPDLNRAQYNSYFKFAFVRNPWGRVYSWFRNVMRDEEHRRAHRITADLELKDFLIQHHDSWALRTQMSWITTRNGNVGVDYIGRFETLNDDFKVISDQLNLDNSELPTALASNNPDWISEYDEESRAIVQSRYADEIAYFNYRFEE